MHHITVEIWRRFCAMLLVVCIVLVAAPHISRSAEEPYAEEWIFEVIMPPQFRITPALIAYQYEGKYYLPVVELAEAFEFYAEAEIDRHYVTGFASREENTFTIDGERGELIVNGEVKDLPSYAILDTPEVNDFDLYVQLEVLNEIWPVNMHVDLANVLIEVEPEEELSFQRRLEREERQERIESAGPRVKEPRLPYVHNPYQWIGKPVLDVQSNFTYDVPQRELTGGINFNGGQQLGKLLAQYNANFSYLEGKIRRPESIRFRVERDAPEGEQLVGLGIKTFEAGDVSVRQRNLVGGAVGGRGVVVSNDPVKSNGEFDRITVEGDAPPGWDIELYNNNELIEFGVVDGDGRYLFENVLLDYGNNRIRVVLYGPQGQVREIVENYSIGGSMRRPGEFRYYAGFADDGRPLILLEDEPRQGTRGVGKTLMGSYGISKNLTILGSYTQLPTQQRGIKEYGSAGVVVGTPLGAVEAEAYKEENGGHAFDIRFATNMFGINLNLRTSFFKDFESDAAGYGDNADKFSTQVQANRNFRLPFGTFGLRLNLRHNESKGGVIRSTVGTTESFSRGGVRFTNSTTSNYLDYVHQTSSGSISSTVRLGRWQTRGALNYTLYPLAELVSGNAEVRYKAKNDFQAALNFQHSFPTALSTIGGQVGYEFEKFLGSVDAQFRQGTGWTFMARASTSLSPYAPDGSYEFSGKSRRNDAPVRGHVFLDKNADGLFDDGDEPLQGVRLMTEGARGRTETNEEGLVVTNASHLLNSNIKIDTQSLQDPYFVPEIPGYSTVPLIGTMPTFELPVVETGAIDGTVYRDDGEPIPGMKLELVNAQGEAVDTVTTAFDGFYSYEFVRPGTYTVRADPSYGVNVPPETVTVAFDDLFAYGIDLQLMEQASKAEDVVDANGESSVVAQTHYPDASSGTSEPAPSSDESGFSAFVQHVRIGEHPDKVRLVMDLSGPVAYEIHQGPDAQTLYIDLPDTGWEAMQSWRANNTPVIQSFDAEPLASGGSRLVVRGWTNIKTDLQGILPPEGDQGYRLYVDIR